MRGAGRHGASTIRWFFQDATTFTIIFLIIFLIIALDPLGGSIDGELCESNTSTLRCNTEQLQSTQEGMAFTITNQAENDIILQTMTAATVNGANSDQKCHDDQTLIRAENTYPVKCTDLSLAENALNKIQLTYTYYESGQTNANTTTGEITIFTEPR